MWRVFSVVLLAACNGDDGGDDAQDDTDTDLPWIIDEIPQTTLEKVDIAWLVDPEWEAGVENIADVRIAGAEVLLLADTDWQQGTINVTGGPLSQDWGKFSQRWTGYPPPPNAWDVLPPGQPLTDARHRDALYTALELKSAVQQNEDFVRPDAHLYVIVLGDRTDLSTDEPITYDAFVTWMQGLPSDSKRLGAIVGIDAAAEYFTTLSEDLGGGGLIYQVGSFEQAIQDQMRQSIQQRSDFPLSEFPSEPPRAITVDVRTELFEFELDSDYLYDAEANTISFNAYVPPVGAKVIVKYLPVGVETPFPVEETGDTGATTGGS